MKPRSKTTIHMKIKHFNKVKVSIWKVNGNSYHTFTQNDFPEKNFKFKNTQKISFIKNIKNNNLAINLKQYFKFNKEHKDYFGNIVILVQGIGKNRDTFNYRWLTRTPIRISTFKIENEIYAWVTNAYKNYSSVANLQINNSKFKAKTNKNGLAKLLLFKHNNLYIPKYDYYFHSALYKDDFVLKHAHQKNFIGSSTNNFSIGDDILIHMYLEKIPKDELFFQVINPRYKSIITKGKLKPKNKHFTINFLSSKMPEKNLLQIFKKNNKIPFLEYYFEIKLPESNYPKKYNFKNNQKN